MVQHVVNIGAELQAPGFREPQAFGDVGIEAPDRECSKDILAQVALLSGERILQENQAGVAAAVV